MFSNYSTVCTVKRSQEARPHPPPPHSSHGQPAALFNPPPTSSAPHHAECLLLSSSIRKKSLLSLSSIKKKTHRRGRDVRSNDLRSRAQMRIWRSCMIQRGPKRTQKRKPPLPPRAPPPSNTRDAHINCQPADRREKERPSPPPPYRLPAPPRPPQWAAKSLGGAPVVYGGLSRAHTRAPGRAPSLHPHERTECKQDARSGARTERPC